MEIAPETLYIDVSICKVTVSENLKNIKNSLNHV